jgi:uncharacterized protein HemY
MIQKVQSPHFFIFSDDYRWAGANVKIEAPVTVVTVNAPDKGYFRKVINQPGTRPGCLAGAYFHLGDIFTRKKHYQKARKYFIRCVQLNPDHRKAREYLSQLEMR